MNVLLTGANGFLGKFISEEVSKKNTLFTLSRNSGDYKVFLENDIPIFKSLFDVVIHAAGKAHSIPKTDSEKRQFHNINVVGTENLLKGLEKTGMPKKFIFISSVSVYGQDYGTNINEDYPLLAKDPYGQSKILAEELVQNWCNKNHIVCTILRLPLLVGEKPPGNLGAMIKALEKGYYFNINGGKAKKSMVLAKDVAFFIPKVALVGGIYNLTDGNHPSFSELSFAISKRKSFSVPLVLAKFIAKFGDILGDKAPINSLKVKKITSDLTFDDSKAREFLDWKPEPILGYLKRKKIS